MCLARTVPISYCCPFLHSPFGVQRSALSGPEGLTDRASASFEVTYPRDKVDIIFQPVFSLISL